MTARSAVCCAGRPDLIVASTTDRRVVVAYRAGYDWRSPEITGRVVDVTRAAGRHDPYDVFHLSEPPPGMAAKKRDALRRDVFAALPVRA